MSSQLIKELLYFERGPLCEPFCSYRAGIESLNVYTQCFIYQSFHPPSHDDIITIRRMRISEFIMCNLCWILRKGQLAQVSKYTRDIFSPKGNYKTCIWILEFLGEIKHTEHALRDDRVIFMSHEAG